MTYRGQDYAPDLIIPLRREVPDIAVDATGKIYVMSHDYERGRDELARVTSNGTWTTIEDLITPWSIQRQAGSGDLFLLGCDNDLLQIARVTEGLEIEDLTSTYFGALDEQNLQDMGMRCNTVGHSALLFGRQQNDWWDVLPDGSLMVVTNTGFWKIGGGKVERVLQSAFETLAPSSQLYPPILRVLDNGEILLHFHTASKGDFTTFRVTETSIEPVAKHSAVEKLIVSHGGAIHYVTLDGTSYGGDLVTFRYEGGGSQEYFRQNVRNTPSVLNDRYWFMEFDAQGNFYTVYGISGPALLGSGQWWLVRFPTGTSSH